MAAGKIFVCYRREDSSGHAGRLYDRLNQRFPGRVFMDVAGIGVGSRWAEVIEQTLDSCEVAVILIGKRWLEKGPDGTRRLDRADDPLRAELTTALRLKLKIIPLLVGGAAVPEHGDLPADVAPITDWQALRIDDDDFDHDSARLVQALESHLIDEGPDPKLDSAGSKQAEIGRLLAAAESSIGRAEWINAAQTLRAVLSLDRTRADAEARLRFVQEQSARAHQPQPQPKAHRGRWAALGAAGAVAVIGGVGIMVVLLALMVSWVQGLGSQPPSLGEARPVDKPENMGRTPQPSPDPQPARPTVPAQPQLAGDYVLTSYSMQGVAVPLTGEMRLSALGEGRFRFDTVVTNQMTGGYFQYHGLFQGQGSAWTTTTLSTNDPTAVSGAIPTVARFDGSTLAMQNTYGQSSVWRKQ